MPAFKTLDDIDVQGRTVLVRGDLNVPAKDGRVTDATRLDRLAPTLRELADKGARVVVLSHFGRPKGGPDPAYTLRPVAEALGRSVGRPVAFAEDSVGPKAQAAIRDLAPGGILVLENVRFHDGEEMNDPALARQFAELGDVFVNDAFSAAHRAHASTEGLAHLLPSAAGRLMQAELEALEGSLEGPERPVAAVVGGAKVSTKLELLHNLVTKVDLLVLGGGMANTFLAAKGAAIGRSLAERDMADEARAILDEAKRAGCDVLLPSDAIVAAELKAGVATRDVDADKVPDDMMILDIGPRSVEMLSLRLQGCRTVVWNGPLGAFETKPFDAGTAAVAGVVAERTGEGRMLSVAGGGDTVAALAQAGVIDGFSYVSTAGGAFLEWLEGKTLPGVAALAR